MKKIYFLVIALSSLIHPLKGQEVAKKFTQKEVIEDLDYLYNSLIDAHHNIYAYVDKDDFKSNYENVKQAIHKDTMNLLEATSIFQKVISAVNNGHTEIGFPAASYRNYAQNGGTVFPLEIAFENGKNIIRKNFSSNTKIKTGDQILSINGLSMDTILQKIYPQVSAERTYFKNAKIELYSFPRYYWQVFGKQDEFEIEILSNGKLNKYNIKSVNLIEGYEMKRNEVPNATMQLKFYDNIAYLNPGNFSGNEIKFQKFIDSSFTNIKNKNTKNLIIDLRNNLGGNDPFSDYLVSYIADKPFKWTSNFTVKTSRFLKEHTRKHSDTTKAYFKEILKHKNGEIYTPKLDFYQPQKPSKRFSGNVYVLINRQSHSQAAVTAAQIQDYNFGIIVGEETGDFPSLYASQFQYNLPNTEIMVKLSKGFITRVNGSTKQEGVIPDIFVKDYLLDEEDEVLNHILHKLNYSKN